MVTSANAFGPGSLDEAISLANAGDTITFAVNLTGDTIWLTTSNTYSLTKNIVIKGPGSSLLTIAGSNNTNGVGFNVNTDSLEISGLSFSNALIDLGAATVIADDLIGADIGMFGTSGSGQLFLSNSIIDGYGGISSVAGPNRKIVLDHVTFRNSNRTIYLGGGSALQAIGVDTVIIHQCSFYNNSTLNATFGGSAIYIEDYRFVEIDSCIIDSCTDIVAGGAISIVSGADSTSMVLINNTSVNMYSGYGAAIYMDNNGYLGTHTNYGTLLINHCYVYQSSPGNQAPTPNIAGGIQIFRFGKSTIKNTTVFNIHGSSLGAGIFHLGKELNLQNSTISGNSVNRANNYSIGGGLIALSGHDTVSPASLKVHIENCTITNNYAYSAGGGVYLDELMNISIINSIIANNTAGIGNDIVQNDSLPIISLGHNLIGDSTDMGLFSTSITDLYGNAANPLDPKLAPLGNYGGSTPTHALKCGSPAIDSGNDTLTIADQRGYGRYGIPDIGAYEQQMNEAGVKPDLGPDFIMDHIDTTLSAGTTIDSVNWYDRYGVLQLADSNDYHIVDADAGPVIVEVINPFGCITRDTVIVDIRVGIASPDNPTFNISLSPNPTTGSVAVTLSLSKGGAGPMQVTVANTLGQVVQQLTLTGTDQAELDLHDAGAGVYFVTVQTESGRAARKLVVE